MRKFGFDTMFVLVQWFLKIWKGWINWQKFSPVCDWVFRFSYCDFAFRWKVGESGRAKKKQQPKNCLKAFQFVRHFGCCTCACDLRQRHRHVKKSWPSDSHVISWWSQVRKHLFGHTPCQTPANQCIACVAGVWRGREREFYAREKPYQCNEFRTYKYPIIHLHIAQTGDWLELNRLSQRREEGGGLILIPRGYTWNFLKRVKVSDKQSTFVVQTFFL